MLMHDEGFLALSSLAYSEAGLVLAPSKSAMIQSRLRHRLKLLNLNDLSAYCEYVESPVGQSEKQFMISALTTNVSSFFREPHHFDLVDHSFLSGLLEKQRKGKKIRIWSAGCSNGQEPYSLAIHILKICPELARNDLRILATDIDHSVLSFAKAGTYDIHQLDGVDDETLRTYFRESVHAERISYHVLDEVSKIISFKKLNLIDDWPMTEKYDLVFCRNVVIYFDTQTQDSLWSKFYDLMKTDGIVCVGHSERISHPGFEAIGPTAYRKTESRTRDLSMTTERIT